IVNTRAYGTDAETVIKYSSALKPSINALEYLITVSASVPYARVLTIVLRQFLSISTQGSKLICTPNADDSRADTRPALYETFVSWAASHCAALAIYVPSLHAPFPPESQFAATSTGTFACLCKSLSKF